MDLYRKDFERFNFRYLRNTTVISACYFLWFGFTTGLRIDHFSFYFILLVGFYAHPISRRLIMGLSVFAFYSFLYDSHKVFPNYLYNTVHVSEPYFMEKALFGFMHNGVMVTPNEYFSSNNIPLIDFLSGFFYLCWMPVPVILAIYLIWTDRPMALRFSLAFLFVNLVGWIIYYGYPAAAPWYVEKYGFTENFTLMGDAAGLTRFDDVINYPLFEKMYTKASNVFAALPSMHSAYPVVAFAYSLRAKLGWINILFAIVMGGIWFAAVYTNHHYIIDVLLGILVAVVGIWLFELIYRKTILKDLVAKWAQRF
ncbi:MAG: phosphatase PAP2 family protein [Cyclobacteriaceae bacterium]